MTVKEGLAKLAKVLGTSLAKVGSAIANASLAGLLKLGILVGVSAAVVMFLFKFFKDRRDAFNDEEEKTPVDRALQVNYADLRNQEELHPLMKKVNKHLRKELKPRKIVSKKLKKGKKTKYRDLFEKIELDNEREELEQHLYRFLNNLEESDRYEEELAKYPSDRTYYNVWANS